MALPFKLIQKTDIERWRAETFWNKEPELLVWVESFYNGQTFFDVGANIGVYSLYAAHLYLDSKIYAFEPHKANFIRLVENAALNEFTNIYTYMLAISNVKTKEAFYWPDDKEGSSGGQIGQSIDEYGNHFEVVSKRMVFTISLDEFCALHNLQPDHIKIDIDGLEHKVVEGMQGILKDNYLKSVLIEVNGENNRRYITQSFLDAGFTEDNIFNKLRNHSRVRRHEEMIRAENVIFVRK